MLKLGQGLKIRSGTLAPPTQEQNPVPHRAGQLSINASGKTATMPESQTVVKVAKNAPGHQAQGHGQPAVAAAPNTKSHVTMPTAARTDRIENSHQYPAPMPNRAPGLTLVSMPIRS